MPPKRRSGAGQKPASRAKGNTVAKCLAAIGVEDAAKTLEGCDSLEAEFRVLKSSYHRAVLRAHPDKGGDREVFEDIQNSFEVLRGMFANREVDSFAQAAASRKSTSRAFEFAESTRPKSTPSWEFYAAAAEEPVPIYRVEPAKSGRSGCSMAGRGPNTRCVRGAPFKIPKGELRVGSIDDQSGSYGRWVHLDCWRVPAKIHQGLPRLGSPEAEDPAAFEAALLSMNEVLLSGVEELEPEIRQLLVRHVMDPTKWAALQVKKIAGAAPADKSKGKGKGKGKGKRAAPEPSSAEPVPSVPVDAGASKKAKSARRSEATAAGGKRAKRPPPRRNLRKWPPPVRRLPRWVAARRRPRRLRVRRRRRWLAAAAGNSSSRRLDPARVCALPALCAARRSCSPASSQSSAAARAWNSAKRARGRSWNLSAVGSPPPCREGPTRSSSGRTRA